MRPLLIFIAAILILIGLAAPAESADPAEAEFFCKPRAEVLRLALMGFGETPRYIGMVDNNTVAEILMSENGATWTLMVTGVTGLSCVVASGENWRERPSADPET